MKLWDEIKMAWRLCVSIFSIVWFQKGAFDGPVWADLAVIVAIVFVGALGLIAIAFIEAWQKS